MSTEREKNRGNMSVRIALRHLVFSWTFMQHCSRYNGTIVTGKVIASNNLADRGQQLHRNANHEQQEEDSGRSAVVVSKVSFSRTLLPFPHRKEVFDERSTL
jgi:hypothetical protein